MPELRPARAPLHLVKVEILYWRNIPVAVKGRGAFATARIDLPSRFQKIMQDAATAVGTYDTDQFWDDFHWIFAGEYEGAVNYCAKSVARELEEQYDYSSLIEMVSVAKTYEVGPPLEDDKRPSSIAIDRGDKPDPQSADSTDPTLER